MSHSDFILPGLAQAGVARWIVPTAWAYSSKCNNRRLEHHFHGIWNLVFQDLIFDLTPSLFVVPQYQIDSLNHGPIEPDHSIATIVQPDATQVTPDFSIVKAHVVPRPAVGKASLIDHQNFTLWDDFRIKAFIVPFIAELKRPPTRRFPSLGAFAESLGVMFDRAHASLEKQVKNAFLMQSAKVDKIIMFACVGEWWDWKIATRDHYSIGNGNDSESSDEETDNVVLSDLFRSAVPSTEPLRHQPARKAKNEEARRKYTAPANERLRPSDKQSYNPRGKGKGQMKERSDVPIRYTDLGVHEMERVKATAECAKPSNNNWSKHLLLATPASNQHFFLIHRFLGTECTPMLYGLPEHNDDNALDDEPESNPDDSEGELDLEDMYI